MCTVSMVTQSRLPPTTHFSSINRTVPQRIDTIQEDATSQQIAAVSVGACQLFLIDDKISIASGHQHQRITHPDDDHKGGYRNLTGLLCDLWRKAAPT